jgi:hypothetical protein
MVKLGTWQSESDIRAGLGLIPANAKRVIVFSKGWEPPLLEFSDFLAVLRDCIGGRPSITVIPINTSATHVDKADREVWAHSLSRHDDRSLYVLQATSDGEPEA